MEKDILIGIDLGTSACKAVAFLEDGSVVATANAPYPVYYPQPGWAEQDPNLWWDAVCAVLKKLSAAFDPQRVRGVGVDGQSWSAVAVDKQGTVLCNTPIWMDVRAESICRALEEKLTKERIFAVSGNPLKPSYTLPKILWYKEHLPELYEKTDKILQSNSFIGLRLTGVISQDKSQGYGLSSYNMREGCWDFALCEDMGIRPDLLPELYDCHQVIGTVTPQAAALCGLPVGTPVVAGGLDAACGTLGTGVVNPGETQEQGGQAGGMSIATAACTPDERLILSNHVVPGLWLLQGGTVGGGGVMNWLEREFGGEERMKSENSFRLMDQEAEAVPAGSGGLVFLPYMAGERSPIWDSNAKAVFYGADYTKTKGHFIRAAMEGVAFSLRHNLEVAAESGATVNVLRAMGGAANSRLWTQMKADVTGKTIVVPGADTATALGAAILAGVGTGVYGSFQEAVEKTVQIKAEYTPNPENQAVYQENYRIYLELYQRVKDL